MSGVSFGEVGRREEGEKVTGYFLFYFDRHEQMWYDEGPIFDTIDDAEKERSAIIKVMPSFKDLDYQIVPNDGKSWIAHRPLDRGDRIYKRR